MNLILTVFTSLLFFWQANLSLAENIDNYQEKNSIAIDEAIPQQAVKQLLLKATEKQQRGNLEEAKTLAEKAYNQSSIESDKAEIIILLAQISFQQGKNEEAIELLNQLNQLEDNKHSQHMLHALLLRANIAQSEKSISQARSFYQQVIDSKNDKLAVVARINKTKVANTSEAKKLLNESYAILTKFSDDENKVNLLLSLCERAIKIDTKLAFDTLNTLENMNYDFSARLLSQRFGLKSKLYYSQKRYDEALILVQQAIFHAQQAPDLLMEWEWQQGKILKESSAAQSITQSISSYRRAIVNLEKIRQDIPVRYVDGSSSFKELLSPLYLEFAELLLSSDHSQSDNQLLLGEVQTTIEQLKAFELVDYFKNACDVRQYPLMDLTKKSPSSAILYPIAFDDKLEILLSIKGQLKRFTVPVTKRKLYRIVRRAVGRVRPTSRGDLRPFSYREIRQLYNWMIKPVRKTLEQAQVDTILFVPNDDLRTLPLAMLWDGKEYLIENFAVATLPGLSLLDPTSLPESSYQVSLAGVSQPGNVVKQLPQLMDTSFIEKTESRNRLLKQRQLGQQNRALNLRSLPVTVRGIGQLRRAPIVLRQQQLRMLQDALALPGVTAEVNSLATILNTKPFLNQSFNLDDFKEDVKGSRIVHIASHALFSGDPDTSFIMAHDRVLDMNEIDKMFKSETFSKHPVELLTLSACQTAEGDDRSPLGLAGVALKSGARSIMGSLWPVSDNAARIMFPSFYIQMTQQGLSKAKSLQLAQKELLKDEEMNHPFYWAPFILIGNWL